MPGLKTRLIALYTLLICANIAAGVWAFALFAGDSVKLGTALLAYSLGVRHAVDADHIAAIEPDQPPPTHVALDDAAHINGRDRVTTSRS